MVWLFRIELLYYKEKQIVKHFFDAAEARIAGRACLVRRRALE
jgi:hypothetical protein